MLSVAPFPYQDEAIDMALELGHGLIAYEMGLGKTICGIAIIEELIAREEIETGWIIVPANLRWQWAAAIAEFTDVPVRAKKVKHATITIPTEDWCIVLDGPPERRDRLYERIETQPPDFVIASYEQIVNDYQLIKDLQPEAIVLDEATAIKGFKAQRSQAVKALGARAPFRVALSGTPLENRPEEVYSIMDFVAPGYLGTPETFDAKFIVRNRHGGVKRYRNLDVLARKLAPVMARKTRLDPDVAPYMPRVSHKDEHIALPPQARGLYREIADLAVAELGTVTGRDFDTAAYYAGHGEEMGAVGRVMARLFALQMLCDHPDLLRHSAQRHQETNGEDGSAFAAWLAETGRLDTNLGRPEKLLALVEDVTDICQSHPENKIVVFSYYKHMGHLIAEALKQALPEVGSVIYNGEMSTPQKVAARETFQQDPDVRLFIASEAAAFGVDLPEANYLINYDLPDSAGKYDQRNARHVRAGSAHASVYVINYLIDGSIEERTRRRIDFKKQVSRAVVDGHRGEPGGERGVIENTVLDLATFFQNVTPE